MTRREMLDKLWLGILSGICALFLLLVHIPIDSFLVVQAIYITLFLALYTIGKYVMQIGQVLHMFDNYELTVLHEFGLLIVTFVVIYIFAGICTYLNQAFLKTKFFQSLQKFFIPET